MIKKNEPKHSRKLARLKEYSIVDLFQWQFFFYNYQPCFVLEKSDFRFLATSQNRIPSQIGRSGTHENKYEDAKLNTGACYYIYQNYNRLHSKISLGNLRRIPVCGLYITQNPMWKQTGRRLYLYLLNLVFHACFIVFQAILLLLFWISTSKPIWLLQALLLF